MILSLHQRANVQCSEESLTFWKPLESRAIAWGKPEKWKVGWMKKTRQWVSNCRLECLSNVMVLRVTTVVYGIVETELQLSVSTSRLQWQCRWDAGEQVHMNLLLCPAPVRWGHNALMAIVCLSVYPVCDPKLRTEGHRKLKNGRKEAHDTGHLWPTLEGERSNLPGRTILVLHSLCVFYTDINVQWTISILWPPCGKL